MSSHSSHPTNNFDDPWASQPPSASHASHASSLYAGSPQLPHGGIPSNGHMDLSRHSHQQPSSRMPAPSAVSMPPYGSIMAPSSAGSPPQPSMADHPTLIPPGHGDLLSYPQGLVHMNNRMQPPTTAAPYASNASVPIYATTAPSPVTSTYAASPTSYEPMHYARRNDYLPSAVDQSRRFSQSSASSGASYEGVDISMPRTAQAPYAASFRNTAGGSEEERREFQKAMEASQGMINMKFDTSSQETPRAGVYNTDPTRGRGSTDSYGFPSAHSTSSSVSSAGFSPSYYGGSVDGGSVSDYSTAGSDLESAGPRALPRPAGLLMTANTQPPAPQSMMNQFSSKVSSSTQKKHKCKVCEKRFTRPSSLQTHMYSHTGEKRTAPSPPIWLHKVFS